MFEVTFHYRDGRIVVISDLDGDTAETIAESVPNNNPGQILRVSMRRISA